MSKTGLLDQAALEAPRERRLANSVHAGGAWHSPPCTDMTRPFLHHCQETPEPIQ